MAEIPGDVVTPRAVLAAEDEPVASGGRAESCGLEVIDLPFPHIDLHEAVERPFRFPRSRSCRARPHAAPPRATEFAAGIVIAGNQVVRVAGQIARAVEDGQDAVELAAPRRHLPDPQEPRAGG